MAWFRSCKCGNPRGHCKEEMIASFAVNGHLHEKLVNAFRAHLVYVRHQRIAIVNQLELVATFAENPSPHATMIARHTLMISNRLKAEAYTFSYLKPKSPGHIFPDGITRCEQQRCLRHIIH